MQQNIGSCMRQWHLPVFLLVRLALRWQHPAGLAMDLQPAGSTPRGAFKKSYRHQQPENCQLHALHHSSTKTVQSVRKPHEVQFSQRH